MYLGFVTFLIHQLCENMVHILFYHTWAITFDSCGGSLGMNQENIFKNKKHVQICKK